VVSSTPRPHFTPRERPATHCTGGWVGPRAGLEERKISSLPGFDPRTVQLQVSKSCRKKINILYSINATSYGLGGPGIESRLGGRDFSAPVQTGPGAHPASSTIGTGSFPGVKSGRGVTLTTHPLLVPWP